MATTRELAYGITIKLCPITGGQKTKMLQSSFERNCKFWQNYKQDQWMTNTERNFINNYCKTCQGKIIPEEIEFIEITMA